MPDTPAAPTTTTTSTTSTTTNTASRIVTVPAPAPIPAGPLPAYATYEQFVLRFQQTEVTEISQPKLANPVSPDQLRVNAALGDATGIIDSYLRVRYEPSLLALHASPSGELVRHTCNIARYHLAQNRATEQMRDMYEDAIRWCEQMIAEGRSLVLKDGTTVSQTDKTGEEGDTVDEDGVLYRDETYSSNMPFHTGTATQVYRRQNARVFRHSFGGGRRYR